MRRVRNLVAVLVALLVVTTGPAGAVTDVNDPAYTQGLQWGLERIGAPVTWERSTGNGIRIAVVDSGADLAHEDLKSKLVGSIACLDTTGDPADCRGSAQDDHGHGTHVAGIAAATTNNGRGIAGVAPGADLMVVRVLRERCDALNGCKASGTADDVSAGIRWAVDHGADVINLSLGSTTDAVLGPSFAEAIEYAWSKGVVSVIAAGNDFILSRAFADEPAIVVAATDRKDGKASYSNGVGNATWAISAPGGEGGDSKTSCATGGEPKGVISTYWVKNTKNQYTCLAGTSMAAPHVAGAATVLLGLGMTPQQTVDKLLKTADDLGAKGVDSTFGAGMVDLAAAVASVPVATTTTTAPAPTPATDAAGNPQPEPAPAGGNDSTGGAAADAPIGNDIQPGTADARDGTPEGALADLEVFEDDDGGASARGLKAVATIMVIGAGGAAIWVQRRGLAG